MAESESERIVRESGEIVKGKRTAYSNADGAPGMIVLALVLVAAAVWTLKR